MNEKNRHTDLIWKKIQAYLTSDKKGNIANRFEQEMEEDPFLKDAMEGWEEYGDIELGKKHLSEIEQYVNYRSEKGKQDKFKALKIAASIFVLFSASIWIYFTLQPINNHILTEKYESDTSIMDQNTFSEMEEELAESIEEPEKVKTEPAPVEKDELSIDDKLEEGISSTAEIEEAGPENSEQNPKVFQSKPDMIAFEDFGEFGSGFSTSATLERNNVNNYDELLSRIMEMEESYWEQKMDQNTLAYSEEESMDMSEPAPSSSSSGLFKNKERKQSKKEAPRSSISGDALEGISMLESESLETEVSELALHLIKGEKQLNDSIDNPELYIIKAIKNIESGNIQKGIDLLNQNFKRDSTQIVLIDSLLGLISKD